MGWRPPVAASRLSHDSERDIFWLFEIATPEEGRLEK
jgi:hypothetical protein